MLGLNLTENRMRHAKPTLFLLAAALTCGHALSAEKKYAPGVTDTEIKLGQTMPYSGPASAYSAIGKSELAYFEMINQRGGVNGRKIRLISLDDGYNPARTVEQVRKLVEEDEVMAIFSPLGTAPNTAIHKYLNAKKVPQLLLHSSANKWNDPTGFPGAMSWPPNSNTETQIFGKYLLAQRPNAKVAALYQNDDYGKDLLKGLRDALGTKADQMIVATASYEVTDPSIDSQVVMLQSSGADALLDATTSKFAAQAVRKVWDMGWKPTHFLTFPSSSIATVLTPAGVEKSVGILSASSGKDPSDPQWAGDADLKDYLAFMKRYYPDGNVYDQHNLVAYISAFMMTHVLTQCGDELTRENVMRQATSMHNLEVPLLLPGIKVNTTSTEYQQIRQLRMRRFDGKRWAYFGDLIDTTPQ
jgi:ABC-type branched-subunit amino acid transport system substrate-binding protein